MIVDFTYTTAVEMDEAIKGKTIKHMEIIDGRQEFLIFHFTDGSSIKIRYDYIYNWEFIKKDKNDAKK
jgi:hypothetical protein